MFAITLEGHKTSTGHRIPGHQGGRGKCARLHGHTYAFDVRLTADVLDETGFVVDYGQVKDVLDEWDHRTLLWQDDPLVAAFFGTVIGDDDPKLHPGDPSFGVMRVPFVPTAENMAKHLAQKFALQFEPVVLATVTVRETDKTTATFTSTPQEAMREGSAAPGLHAI